MANRYIKIYSTSLITREMQIKTTVRYFTPVRKAIIKKTGNNNVARMWRKENSCALFAGNLNWFSHYGKQYRSSTKNYK